ncbi:MAG: exo-alpha-sialidase [Bacteroidetes bacterium]|nr:exo-alpha-sialidase [Bacteroidota bacterium]
MKFNKLYFLFLFIITNSKAQVSIIRNNYTEEKNIPHLRIQREMIYAPEKEWLYSHHASITRFKNKFIAIWSNGMIDEDAPGQRVLFSVSSDFFHWSVPQVLAKPSPYTKDTLNILTAAGFHQFKDTLVAYYGEYSPQRTNTNLWAKVSTDGEHWSDALNIHVPVNPNHGPQKINNGRLIISGNFTFPYTDDPRGLSGWRMSSFYNDSLFTQDNPATFYSPAKKMHLPPLCEGSFFQTPDDVLHALLRVTGDGWKGKLWVTESKDNGEHWSFPAETNFTDNDSKFHFGKLPDGRFYYVGIPDTLHHYARTPLVIAVSNDGIFFNRQFIIADELYTLKKAGLWKDGQYGYPHTIIYDGMMYVIISRQKEAVEVIRFDIGQLKK